MTGAEFYEKHNIGRSTFARICATGTDTLDKYWNGDKMRDKTRSKIDQAVRYFEENNVDWGHLSGMDRYIRPGYADEIKWRRRNIIHALGLGGVL